MEEELKKQLQEWLGTYEEMVVAMDRDIKDFEDYGKQEAATFMRGRKVQTTYVITRLQELLGKSE